MRALLCGLLLAFAAGDSWWATHPTGVDSNLRGLALVVHRSSVNVWATGSKGTILHSADGGNTWQPVHIAGAESLDFRGVQTFDSKAVYVMSSGSGDASRIYKSEDGGVTWKVQYTDKRKSFFLDALLCSDEKHCFALSDPVDGKFLLLATSDGSTWKELPREHMPLALPQEGAFAASNSCLLLFGKSELYFATGGAQARVFHSAHLGQTWTVSETPLGGGKPSQGIFSIVRAGDTLVVVGGDHEQPNSKQKTAAYSLDDGTTWHLAEEPPAGYRSAVDTYDAGFVAVGLNGAETSRDGIHWMHIDSPGLNAVTFISGKGWGVGPKGQAAEFLDKTEYSTESGNP
ncbi:MAG TPA: hypothetical protein VMU53_00475 [Candidatus Sulfotelmatobacter sp.]|nr:hypothetical protein [Candidatus Sulfotelmatobacter sp.]